MEVELELATSCDVARGHGLGGLWSRVGLNLVSDEHQKIGHKGRYETCVQPIHEI